MENKLTRLTGLWANRSKDGNSNYLKGKLGQADLLIFKNKNKRPESNDPDYYAFVAESQVKQQPKQDKPEDNLPF